MTFATFYEMQDYIVAARPCNVYAFTVCITWVACMVLRTLQQVKPLHYNATLSAMCYRKLLGREKMSALKDLLKEQFRQLTNLSILRILV